MTEDEAFNEMIDAFVDAGEILETYNDQAPTNQRVTHQGRIIPNVAFLLYQNRMGQMKTPADNRTFG